MLKSLLGGHYLVVDKQEPSFIPTSYELVHETTNEQVYKNSISTQLGYATTKTVSPVFVKNLDKSVEEYVFLNAIIDEKSPNMNLDISKFEKLAEQQINQGISLNKKEGYLFIDYSTTVPSSLVSVECRAL